MIFCINYYFCWRKWRYNPEFITAYHTIVDPFEINELGDHINGLKIKLNDTNDLGLTYKYIIGNCSLYVLLQLIIHNNNIPCLQIHTILMFVIYVTGQRSCLCNFKMQLPAMKYRVIVAFTRYRESALCKHVCSKKAL